MAIYLNIHLAHISCQNWKGTNYCVIFFKEKKGDVALHPPFSPLRVEVLAVTCGPASFTDIQLEYNLCKWTVPGIDSCTINIYDTFTLDIEEQSQLRINQNFKGGFEKEKKMGRGVGVLTSSLFTLYTVHVWTL